MKPVILLIMSILSSTIFAQSPKTLYNFTTKSIDGDIFNLSSLRGKKVLIVNTASECGLTPQYKDLEALYQKYGGDNFVIIGFPANNFGEQEPGNNKEISEFCTKNFGVTFPMMSKISVKGDDIDPIYRWLTNKSENGLMDAPVQWNFQKFLIDENGKLVDMVPPKELPTSERIIKFITSGK
jgi:glutathione peroxidase